MFSRGLVLLLLGAALIGAVVGAELFGGGSSRDTATTKSPAQGNVSLRTVEDRALGIAIGQPPGWTVSHRQGVIRLASPDRSVMVAVSAPAGAGAALRIRRSDKSALLKLFRPARVIGRQKGTIGGRPVLTSELIGTTSGHAKIRVLSTAVSDSSRTYSIAVFSTLRPMAKRLLETSSVLGSIRFLGATH